MKLALRRVYKAASVAEGTRILVDGLCGRAVLDHR
jgi:uncharacterized protein YeaO (DUF488 family)